MARSRIAAALVVAMAGVAVAATATQGYAATSDEPTGIVVRDGATQPVFDYNKAITEDVFVEVPIDSDSDGQPDRVHLAITRPGETATSGLKVGTLLVASPYNGDFADVPYPSVDVDRLPQETPAGARHGLTAGSYGSAQRRADDEADPNNPWDKWPWYVSRGYAMIGMDSLGTAGSTGCPDSGGPNETAAMRAVVDWLGGHGKAFDTAGNPLSATWSAGSIGMYGASYGGTLPIAVAVTGAPELKTILPTAAVTSWYDEYRANGLVRAAKDFQGEDADIMSKLVVTRQHPEACAAAMDRLTRDQDRTTGDYNAFWAQRDYNAKAAGIKASVFLVAGTEDWNVKPKQFARFWDALGRTGTDRKLWLYDTGHTDSYSEEQLAAEHRWIDHYIYGVDTGIEDEPPVTLQPSLPGSSTPGPVVNATAWPDPAAEPVTLPLAPGKLGTIGNSSESFTDNGNTTTAEDLVAGPDTANPHRLAYLTPALRKQAHLSGTPRVTIAASIDNRTAANLTALLVDYGPAGTEPVIVTRGWMDPQNRTSLSRSEPVTPGQAYRFSWEQEPDEHVFPAGHRIGLVIISTDYDYTLRPSPGTRITVRTGASSLQLPISGGKAALSF